MNLIGIIILVTLAGDFIFNITAAILNLSHLLSELPEGFQDVYSPERYRKSQAYLRTRTRSGCVFELFPPAHAGTDPGNLELFDGRSKGFPGQVGGSLKRGLGK